MLSRVVILTDRQVMPPLSGNRIRILGLIRAIKALGCHVEVISADVNGVDELAVEVDELTVAKASPYLGGDPCSFDTQPFFNTLKQSLAVAKPVAVIAEYAWLAPALSAVEAGVPRWVDCHDILHERTTRFEALGLDPWVKCTREQERELLDCADGLIAINPRDARILQALLPNKRVINLLPAIDLPRGFRRVRSDERIVLAVGAAHAGNEGVRQFASTLWGNVASKLPNAVFEVVGAIGQGIDEGPQIRVMGEVEDLYSRYRSAAVVLCPVVVGTGIKIKMIEALRLGKAVVATEAAAEGLPKSRERSWFTVGSVAECAEAVAMLLNDCDLRVQLEDAAFKYGQRYFSQSRFRTVIGSVLNARNIAATTAQT
jgi:glycosyltransferase involved in cell wall biosynthesis